MEQSKIDHKKLYENKKPRVEFYQNNSASASQRYRWRLMISDNEVATSSDGTDNRKNSVDDFMAIENYIRYLRENGLID
ncbi:MAG: hypothetical protein M3139_09570 [Bacteroidota bacterium]|nr:hypothetical protein [Bacteroidota bacterium]